MNRRWILGVTLLGIAAGAACSKPEEKPAASQPVADTSKISAPPGEIGPRETPAPADTGKAHPTKAKREVPPREPPRKPPT